MVKNLKTLEKAVSAFYDLEQKAATNDNFKVPKEYHKHFKMAAFAAAKLYSLGIDKLKKLEKERRVHNSTITGNSLFSALYALERYYLEDIRSFSSDNYEQLGRTCQSVIMLEKCEKF